MRLIDFQVFLTIISNHYPVFNPLLIPRVLKRLIVLQVFFGILHQTEIEEEMNHTIE